MTMSCCKPHFFWLCMICACTSGVLKAQVFVEPESIPDVMLFTGSSGDDWQEVGWIFRNLSFFPISQHVLTREIVTSEFPLNQGAATERFCLGELCFLAGTESSPPFSLGAFQEIVIKANYKSLFMEGAVSINYCVHGVSETPSDGICHQVEFSYSLDGYLPGCTAPYAMNYLEDATVDDGSCIFDNNGQTYNEGYAQGFEDGQSQGLTCPSDADQDGLITVADLLALLSVFGASCQ